MIINNPRTRSGQEGFTLVELMIVVAIIGILAVLAIFGVTKYVQNAKTGEARNALGMISKSAVGAYEQERAASALLGPGGVSCNVHAFCLTATNVPVTVANVYDKKYQSNLTDWNGDALTGWKCLKFSLTEPQYFEYGYTGTAQGGYNGWATAYFNKAGTVTHGFALGGALVGSQVVVQPQMTETADVEPSKAVPAVGAGT